MAAPGAIAAAKAAAALLTSEKGRKGIGCLVTIVLSPLIVIIAILAALFSGTASHNSHTVDVAFNGGTVPSTAPTEFRQSMDSIQQELAGLDGTLGEINGMAEDGTVDTLRVKAAYYSLFFGSGTSADGRAFADCFVRYEDRKRKMPGKTLMEIYTAAIPLDSFADIYANLEAALGRSVSVDERNAAAEIYHQLMYGDSIPDYGDEFDDWISGIPLTTEPFIGADGFCSPMGADWRGLVSSEFGYRTDPFTRERKWHGGIDFGAPKGTPIRAALGGKAVLVRQLSTGYGFHVMLDHGGGFTTMYAHCSKILVYEGQAVETGDVIAELGSTGRSTGPHLHFEVRSDGEKQNPRSYLP